VPPLLARMISHKHRCIFVHIPKCGGSSIEDVIWPGPRTEADLWKGRISEYHNKYQTEGLQHLQARHIRQEVGASTFDSYFKFAIVRNPWDKAISQYLFLKRQRPDLRRFIGVTRFVSLRRYLLATQKRLNAHWDEQYNFVHDDEGRLMVDYVGRFEDLEGAFRHVARTLGLPDDVKLPHAKAAKRKHYREYYDDETREIVARMYRRDIETFHYDY
jgi:chondroitin 4-sulfotransferase 11